MEWTPWDSDPIMVGETKGDMGREKLILRKRHFIFYFLISISLKLSTVHMYDIV